MQEIKEGLKGRRIGSKLLFHFSMKYERVGKIICQNIRPKNDPFLRISRQQKIKKICKHFFLNHVFFFLNFLRQIFETRNTIF